MKVLVGPQILDTRSRHLSKSDRVSFGYSSNSNSRDKGWVSSQVRIKEISEPNGIDQSNNHVSWIDIGVLIRELCAFKEIVIY